MAKFEKDKLDEIINVELDGGSRKPGLMEVPRDAIDRLFPKRDGVEYRISETKRDGGRAVPISDGENVAFLERVLVKNPTQLSASSIIVEHFDKLHEENEEEYLLFVNEPPRTISEHIRRKEEGELIPTYLWSKKEQHGE